MKNYFFAKLSSKFGNAFCQCKLPECKGLTPFQNCFATIDPFILYIRYSRIANV
jgi:hypothetical protein